MQNKKITGLAVGGVILLILVLWIFFSYNSLVKKEEKVKLQWSEVQSTYQRRLDLVPSLVNVVKGVSDFEQTTLEKITQARAKALSGLGDNELTAENFQNQKNLQDSLASAANRIIILIEKYPSLKGTAAYSGLQTQLEGTERRIKVARSDFNESVEKYNRKVRSFPSNIIAGLFGFKKKTGFEAAGGSDRPVDIKFN
jgi:LemA protein